ncbi:MAG TPA: biotin/lipoyl-containing protein, partial [Phenylobacterium sp.]|nr:biotin/lipoyl-containing protein [Phenylobacterium sp.]
MTDVLMPALSPTMEEGTLAKWHVKVGDSVKSGDVIAEIETDKATMEVEAVDEGTVEALLVPEGAEEVKVNTPIARLSGEAGAAPPAPQPAAAPEPAPASRAEASGDPERRPPELDAKPRPEGEGAAPVRPSQPLKDPELPAGVTLAKVTVRDALRDA